MQRLPQMTLEIEDYDAPPGTEKLTVVKNEDLEHYVKTMVETGGFKDQYKMLRSGQQKPWEVGRKPENKVKNRYQDLLPYDDGRVVLQKLKNDPHSDYINASHVEGYEGNISYICTQGPLDKTVGDFWRMVWQEDVNVISMTANIIENGKKKCEKYWPDKTLKIADLVVSFQSEQVFLDYTVRNFKLQKSGTSGHRCVRQYQYTAWPDHGVPPSPLPVLAMLEDTRRYQGAQGKRTPWVLHCSAGVGRSGAVMLLDAALQMSLAEGRVDVLGLLYAMRQRRVSLIETLEQYTFVYKALVEFHFGDVSCKAATEMVLYFNKLRQLSQETRKTGLEQQFERLRAMEPPSFLQKCVTATTENNKSKNRDSAILPPDDGRPILKTSPPSNYINAVYTYGYGQQNRFVVTQFPLPGTIADFWQLVCDTGTTCVVVVNELSSKDESNPAFWPKSGIIYYGATKVEHLASEPEYFSGVLTRKFKVKNPKGKSRILKMFHLHGWRRDELIPPQPDYILQLIAKVDRWADKNHLAPIIVTCNDGSRASGFFCAAFYLEGQIRDSRKADVVQAVRTVRLFRPSFIPTVEQYRWLYEFVCFLVSDKKILR